MEQRVQGVSERAGIPITQASQAAQTVLRFRQDRLPGPLAAQVSNVLGSQNAQQQQQGGNIIDQANGMFSN